MVGGGKVIGGSGPGAAVERPSALWLALILLVPAIAGCIQDRERRHLDPEWNPQTDLDEAPAIQRQGAPSMLEATGTVGLPVDVNITMTGIEGQLSHGNRTIEVQPLRVQASEGTQAYQDAEGALEIDPGENVTVTLVPTPGQERRANPDLAWNASIELRWKYEQGNEFDANKLEITRNLTPNRLQGLGLGVVERSEGEVQGLLFEAIDTGSLPEETEVSVVHVSQGTAETLETRDANLTVSDSTARATFANPLELPEQPGYLVFRTGDPAGAATTELDGGEEPVPGFGLGAALVALGVAVLLARRS